MSGHDPLDTVRTGVGALRRGTTLAPPAPPARTPATPAQADTEEASRPAADAATSATDASGAADVDAETDADADGEPGQEAPAAPARARRNSTRRRRDTTAKEPDNGPADAERDDGLPGFARGARRQIGVGLTEATFERLRAARTNQFSNGDIVLEALRRTHAELVAEYAPTGDDSDDLFPAEPRRKRRLGIEGVRRMEFMCSPAEAAVIGELAQRCDLSLSALIEAALTRHLTGAQASGDTGERSREESNGGQDHPGQDQGGGANDPTR